MSLPCAADTGKIELEPGTQLGRFQIRRKLGSGSFGTAYLVFDEVDNEEVALKVVDIGPSSPDYQEALQREMAAYHQIQDLRHILKIHDLHSFAYGGTRLLTLSMEYADGGTLREWLDRHKDDPAVRHTEGLRYFKMVCVGIVAAHEAGVCHLDIDPRNLLFAGGVLKVADFGLSAVKHKLAANIPDVHQNVPYLFGNPLRMPPEQFVAATPEELDVRADVYYLGVLLYEMLHPHGYLPYRGSCEHLRELHMNAPVPPLPEASEKEYGIISKCMAKDPSQRYQTVHDLLMHLERLEDPAQDADGADAGLAMDELWQQIAGLIENGSLNDAHRLCGSLLERYPDHQDAAALMHTLDARSEHARLLYETIDHGMGSYSLDDIRELLSEATESYPDHPTGKTVQIRLTVKAVQYRKAMKAGVQAIRQADWDAARNWLDKAEEANPGSHAAVIAKQFLGRVTTRIQEVRRSIDQAIAQRESDRAMVIARKLDNYIRSVIKHIPPVDEDD